MSAFLLPCESCQRHLKSSERTCPHCGVPFVLADRPRPTRALPHRGRLSRAALVLGGVLTGTVLAAGCGSDDTDEGGRDGAVDDDGGAVGALYGAPVDGSRRRYNRRGGRQHETETRPGGAIALYGQPPEGDDDADRRAVTPRLVDEPSPFAAR